QPKKTASDNIRKNTRELENVYRIVRANFVVEPNQDKLFESAMKGMVSSLDPYSEYMDADEYSEFLVSTQGEFGGIGIEISIEDGFITVISPIEDTPAFRAGILPGDKILEVNGDSAEGMSSSECAKRVRGKPGTSVNLKILHKNEDSPEDITLVREIIKLKSVKDVKVIDKESGIGYLRITNFQVDTSSLFDAALEQLKKEEMKSLIIDLRFNGGGIMDDAVKITNRFISSGIILSLKGRTVSEEIKAESSETTMPTIPLVVLVNGSSASASEILAGALKDHHRATLIGSRSYGKGSVQTTFPVTDESKNIKGSLKLTIARYYTPSGRCLERDKDKKDYGLEPDIVVEMSPKEEAQLLKYRLKSNQSMPADDLDEDLSKFADVQLERAIKFLATDEHK
ncbi:MAG: S41 family peptidase, partial [Planctomycetota bacterium]